MCIRIIGPVLMPVKAGFIDWYSDLMERYQNMAKIGLYNGWGELPACVS